VVVGVTAGLVAALLFGCGAVLQAHAVRRHETSADRLRGFVAVGVRDPLTMLVVAMYLGGFVLHAVAIWKTPLYLAQATVAMSLPVTAVTSLALRERLTRAHWAALAGVTAGLVLLALGSGAPGRVIITSGFVLALAGGVLALALVAQWGTGLGGGALGAIAGLGYAGSAIAVRGVDDRIDPLVTLAALAVPSFSLVAFWLYSLGMARALVSSVTAPLIVAQTLVPALVGVALLDDQVRTGWWPAVAVGLALATGGAVLLGRESLRSPSGEANGSAPGPAR
jgi:drug/metabolite transporter (DMT)-like permease